MNIPSNAGLYQIFAQAVAQRASDIHIMVGQPPILRIQGVLSPLKEMPLYTAETLLQHMQEVITPRQAERYLAERDLDTVILLNGGERFRVNMFWENDHPALAARFIPCVIPPLADLRAPEATYDFVNMQQGLVLVTGRAGAGKSTLLASMIEEINATRAEHIITLEDPIEFLYSPKQSIIAQRQYGQDFLTFPDGLKHVLRQDPNVILVGEMRDPETIATTITLAETGHLVFATLHTINAADTINRIVDSFPGSQQQQIRLQLSFVLSGIISRVLIPRTDGTLIAAHETLVNNIATANLIRESNTTQIQNVLYSAQKEHMNTLDQDLAHLVREKEITRETALAYIRDVSILDRK